MLVSSVLSVTLFHLRCCCFLWSPVYVCQSLYFTYDVVVFYGALSVLVLSVTLFYLRCCCFLWSPVCVSFGCFVSHSISPEM